MSALPFLFSIVVEFPAKKPGKKNKRHSDIKGKNQNYHSLLTDDIILYTQNSKTHTIRANKFN